MTSVGVEDLAIVAVVALLHMFQLGEHFLFHFHFHIFFELPPLCPIFPFSASSVSIEPSQRERERVYRTVSERERESIEPSQRERERGGGAFRVDR